VVETDQASAKPAESIVSAFVAEGRQTPLLSSRQFKLQLDIINKTRILGQCIVQYTPPTTTTDG